jgi:thioredoxin-related protein
VQELEKININAKRHFLMWEKLKHKYKTKMKRGGKNSAEN